MDSSIENKIFKKTDRPINPLKIFAIGLALSFSIRPAWTYFGIDAAKRKAQKRFLTQLFRPIYFGPKTEDPWDYEVEISAKDYIGAELCVELSVKGTFKKTFN